MQSLVEGTILGRTYIVGIGMVVAVAMAIGFNAGVVGDLKGKMVNYERSRGSVGDEPKLGCV